MVHVSTTLTIKEVKFNTIKAMHLSLNQFTNTNTHGKNNTTHGLNTHSKSLRAVALMNLSPFFVAIFQQCE